MVRVLRKSPFLGVGMDESRDRSSEKHVVFVVPYLDGDAVRTSFLQIEKMEDDKVCKSQHSDKEGMHCFICLH